MSDNRETTFSADTELLFGVQLAVVHIFNCLNGKGVLPFSESIQSLRQTMEQAQSAPRGAKVALASIINSLEIIAAKADEPNPFKPPPPTVLH